jgi:UDP-N-acetylmuramoylalanine--D-glutamate ligase
MQALGVPEADDPAALAAAATGYGGLQSRLQVIGTRSGVTFVDDSLSTNVLPTLAAVEAFPERRVALIVGGQDRGIDYRALGDGLRARRAPVLVVTIPDNGPHIRQELESTDPGPAITAVDAPDLDAAVHTGYEWARPDGVVLLSPAAPSFGHFRDYQERGAVFAAAMRRCR